MIGQWKGEPGTMLPEIFQFDQSKLQDYVDCPRRFQLRYVLMQPWPALVVEPAGEAERQMQRGADFHRLAQQAAAGLEPDRLAATIHDLLLAQWWQTWLATPPADLPPAGRRAEVVVAAPLASYRLVAKFDLVASEQGERLVVVDWKTMARRPTRAELARRLQTRVYRYLAVEAGATLFGGQRPQPAQVEMVYWLAQSGGDTERFPYDAAQYAADSGYLADLVAGIAAQGGEIWPLTAQVDHCRCCNYRSLCERGVKPGFLQELGDDLEDAGLEIDLEQIAEMAF